MIFPFYFILFYLLCRVTCSVSLVLQCVPRKMFCLIADSVQISLKAHFNQTVGVNYDHNLGLALPLPFPFPCDKIIIFHPLVGTIDFPFLLTYGPLTTAAPPTVPSVLPHAFFLFQDSTITFADTPRYLSITNNNSYCLSLASPYSIFYSILCVRTLMALAV